MTQLSLKTMLKLFIKYTFCRQKKSGIYTKMIGLKVKSYNTTKNLENITFAAMVEHQTMSKLKKLMVLKLLCCKILYIYYV